MLPKFVMVGRATDSLSCDSEMNHSLCGEGKEGLVKVMVSRRFMFDSHHDFFQW